MISKDKFKRIPTKENLYLYNKLNIFLVAAIANKTDMLKYLLKYGTDINKTDKNGNTALIYGSKMGNIDVVKLLLKEGANQSIKNNDGMTALDLAKTKDIQKLLGKKVLKKKLSKKMRGAGTPEQDTFIEACKNGDLDKIRELINADKNILNYKDSNGSTGIMNANDDTRLYILKLLIEISKKDITNYKNIKSNNIVEFVKKSSVNDLITHYYDLVYILQKKFKLKELKDLGFKSKELINIGFTLEQLVYDGKFTKTELEDVKIKKEEVEKFKKLPIFSNFEKKDIGSIFKSNIIYIFNKKKLNKLFPLNLNISELYHSDNTVKSPI